MRRVVQFVAGLSIATSALANESGDDGATAQFPPGPAQQPPSAANPAPPKAADPPSQASPQPQAEAQPAANPGYRLVTLHGFSCGDFCYLELTAAGQREPRTFVCLAQLCGDWGRVDNEELPAGLKMARAEAQFATVGCQVDDYPVCTEVKNGGSEAVIDLRLVERAD
jgi:hypothetical protein